MKWRGGQIRKQPSINHRWLKFRRFKRLSSTWLQNYILSLSLSLRLSFFLSLSLSINAKCVTFRWRKKYKGKTHLLCRTTFVLSFSICCNTFKFLTFLTYSCITRLSIFVFAFQMFFFCSLSSWCFKTTYSWLFLESYPQSFISFPSFWK